VARLQLADEPAPISGQPFWIERSLNVKAGRDPLGLQTITLDRIMPILLPGILVLSRRARYFTLFPFLLKEYERLRTDPTNEGLSAFVKMREFEFAAAVQLCPNGCGEISAGAVGKDRAVPALSQLDDGGLPRQESVKSFLGGYGLYYRTPLVELGLVLPKGTPIGEHVTPVDVLVRDERAQALADAFAEAVADTRYMREHMLGDEPIPLDVLEEYSESACLCRLPQYPREQELLRTALFDAPRGQVEAVEHQFEQRRRSFALFLNELERHAEPANSDAAFRDAIWDDFLSEPNGVGSLVATRAQWAALVAKEYLQEALSCVFAQFWLLGLASQPPDGLTAAGLDDLIAGPLLGSPMLQLPGEASIDYGAGTPTEEFAAKVVEATAGQSLEQLRTWAIEAGTASAGLALAFTLIDRLPQRDTAAPEWALIGLQHADRQPSLLGFAYLLEQHLDEQPTLAQTMRWTVRRFVLAAHEQIAYSKLPDFTFRFRWEGGRLRFYPIGEGRFDLANVRRESMARLSEDIGLWRMQGERPHLSDEGRHFVGEVFG
jgi:hypothetical protein